MLDVMRCLDEELTQVPAHGLKAYMVLRVLLDASIKALEQGNAEPQTFDRPTILRLCESKENAARVNPSRWLTQSMLETFLDARKGAILARLERAGLQEIPAIGTNDSDGGSGIQRLFWLKTRPVERDTSKQEGVIGSSAQIVYTRSDVGAVKPAWWLRLLFKNGELKNRSWRGLSLLLVVLIGMVMLATWLVGGLWSVALVDQALTFRQLATAFFMCGCAWVVWRSAYLPWWQLVDDRVIKVPSLLLSILEDSAELEMYRDSEKSPWTRFVRFTGDCPLCSGRVSLMPGKPEHKLPLVGRCSESPHAHVFSFDRARLSGIYIGPRPGS
ncbi:hypothetical protein D3879_03105 [Pseudomonas cavernicola]|uniref:Uncharacterized protein n=1 Tax=Pseudomonas cavernicola TaxID=2320866 RepID=A0A418XIN1_9PSED|nr:hypothetical protein [Pseudomonas cavernicola]RJG12301.1 hypothetical protein D3879_03105 [Pseudomonas cavernicola]